MIKTLKCLFNGKALPLILATALFSLSSSGCAVRFVPAYPDEYLGARPSGNSTGTHYGELPERYFDKKTGRTQYP